MNALEAVQDASSLSTMMKNDVWEHILQHKSILGQISFASTDVEDEDEGDAMPLQQERFVYESPLVDSKVVQASHENDDAALLPSPMVQAYQQKLAALQWRLATRKSKQQDLPRNRGLHSPEEDDDDDEDDSLAPPQRWMEQRMETGEQEATSGRNIDEASVQGPPIPLRSSSFPSDSDNEDCSSMPQRKSTKKRRGLPFWLSRKVSSRRMDQDETMSTLNDDGSLHGTPAVTATPKKRKRRQRQIVWNMVLASLNRRRRRRKSSVLRQ